MHKHYNNILPCHNKLLQQRWDTKYYNEHRQKVAEAVPMVDTKAPQTYMHLHLKPKKLQLEEERLAIIERDNRILLEKMSNTMRTRGRVDNINNYVPKSLNREKRQRELLRVTRENHAIMQRVTDRKPEYDHQQLLKDWNQNKVYMDNISHYNPDWWAHNKKRMSPKDEAKEDSAKEEQPVQPPKGDDPVEQRATTAATSTMPATTTTEHSESRAETETGLQSEMDEE